MTLIDDLTKLWNIECIIFDLDGTIIDTLDKHIRAFELLFQEEAIDIPVSRIAENMGRTPKDTLRALIPSIVNDISKHEKYAERKEEILTTLLRDIPILDGTIELLDYLKSKEFKLCLASSTPRFNVIKMLKDTNLLRFFTTIITAEDILIGKPNPDVFLKAAKKANAKIAGKSQRAPEARRNDDRGTCAGDRGGGKRQDPRDNTSSRIPDRRTACPAAKHPGRDLYK